MHLITGMVLALLAGRKKTRTSFSPLLSKTGPLITRHLIAGRVRFYAPSLQGKKEKARMVEDRLGTIEGVKEISASPLTGSILIHFDESILQADLLAAGLIKLLDLEKELEKTPASATGRKIGDFLKDANRAVYDKTDGLTDLRTALALAMAIAGVYKIASERSNTLPAGVTLLWWAYMALQRAPESFER
jgi:hypothetical protein